MNAQDARKIAKQVNIGENSQLSKIIDQIKKEAEKGKYSMWFYESISDDSRLKLQEEGYKIGATQFDRNETLTEIKW